MSLNIASDLDIPPRARKLTNHAASFAAKAPILITHLVRIQTESSFLAVISIKSGHLKAETSTKAELVTLK